MLVDANIKTALLKVVSFSTVLRYLSLNLKFVTRVTAELMVAAANRRRSNQKDATVLVHAPNP